MSKKVLIASLGDHPAVVTAMVKMLEEQENIKLDEVVVFYTTGSGKLITWGYDYIKEILDDKTVLVIPEELDFADPTTKEQSFKFLQRLAYRLDIYENGNDEVYLSLAGGRKNMSALMAVICQFYGCVKGLYHLLDTLGHSFPSIEDLFHWHDNSPEKWRNAMLPDKNDVNLVSIPYQTFSKAVELKRYFSRVQEDDTVNVTVTSEVESFFRAIFGNTPIPHRLELCFTKTAWDKVEKLHKEGGETATNFFTCFKQMQDITSLQSNVHGTFNDDKVFHFYKRRRTKERPFFYTSPQPVHLYSLDNKETQPVNRVVICDLSLELDNGNYQPTAEEILHKGDFKPHRTGLPKKSSILLVPLGESPMVATQTYTLLQQDGQDWESRKVSNVAVIYPQQNGKIANGVQKITKVFKRKHGIELIDMPIAELTDIDSSENCKAYLRELLQAIEKLRTDYPDKEVVLSLSGGRKGMSALTLFAAQQAKVNWVYHTLITDPLLEKRVLEETQYDVLAKMSTKELVSHLFLEHYQDEIDKFTLFPIPVIGFEQSKD